MSKRFKKWEQNPVMVDGYSIRFLDSVQHGNDVMHDASAQSIAYYMFHFLPRFAFCLKQKQNAAACQQLQYGTFGNTESDAPPLSRLVPKSGSAWEYSALFNKKKHTLHSSQLRSPISIQLGPMLKEMGLVEHKSTKMKISGTLSYVAYTSVSESASFTMQMVGLCHSSKEISTLIPSDDPASKLRLLRSEPFCFETENPEKSALEVLVVKVASNISVVELAFLELAFGCKKMSTTSICGGCKVTAFGKKEGAVRLLE
jgi:hypothetical protein